MSLVSVRFSPDRSRAAFTLRHPKGNIITAEMVEALRAGFEGLSPNRHLKLVTVEGPGRTSATARAFQNTLRIRSHTSFR